MLATGDYNGFMQGCVAALPRAPLGHLGFCSLVDAESPRGR